MNCEHDIYPIYLLSEGDISLTSALDYETTTSYDVVVEINDGASTATATLTVNINDVNEAPVIISLDINVQIYEDVTSGYLVAYADVIDDENDVITYSITNMWPSGGPFAVLSDGKYTWYYVVRKFPLF